MFNSKSDFATRTETGSNMKTEPPGWKSHY